MTRLIPLPGSHIERLLIGHEILDVKPPNAEALRFDTIDEALEYASEEIFEPLILPPFPSPSHPPALSPGTARRSCSAQTPSRPTASAGIASASPPQPSPSPPDIPPPKLPRCSSHGRVGRVVPLQPTGRTRAGLSLMAIQLVAAPYLREGTLLAVLHPTSGTRSRRAAASLPSSPRLWSRCEPTPRLAAPTLSGRTCSRASRPSSASGATPRAA